MRGVRLLAGLPAVLMGLVGAGTAAVAESRRWPSDFVGRLEALALIETLNADLLSHDSATLTLDAWCARHGLAPASDKVVAKLDRNLDKRPSAAQLTLLGVGTADAVRYRRVRLSCGGHVVSEADNWYVPARLTAAMNEALETTDVSFGRAVQALHFHRRTLSSALLWHPLPTGWETGTSLEVTTSGSLAIPHDLLEHRAVLSLPDGTPFSALIETYTAAVLDFAVSPRQPR